MPFLACSSSWVRALAIASTLAASLVACSGDDTNGTTYTFDASQPPIPKIEAGAPCATNNDCQTGLVCLYPATNCQAFQVCTTPPADPCDNPQPACSCFADPITVCDGYTNEPFLSLGNCEDGGAVVIVDSGGDSTVSTSNDAGQDSAAPSADASDASGE